MDRDRDLLVIREEMTLTFHQVELSSRGNPPPYYPGGGAAAPVPDNSDSSKELIPDGAYGPTPDDVAKLGKAILPGSITLRG